MTAPPPRHPPIVRDVFVRRNRAAITGVQMGMDYCLDAGDGSASIWTGPPELDLDGDGLLDDVLTDLDDDGLADHAVLDLDDDGVPDRFTDDRSGGWSVGGMSGPVAVAGPGRRRDTRCACRRRRRQAAGTVVGRRPGRSG